MVNAEKYGSKLDYTQRFAIGRGTDTEMTCDSDREITAYLYGEMPDMAAHFCHVYDREKRRITSGGRWRWCFITGGDPVTADIWEQWN